MAIPAAQFHSGMYTGVPERDTGLIVTFQADIIRLGRFQSAESDYLCGVSSRLNVGAAGAMAGFASLFGCILVKQRLPVDRQRPSLRNIGVTPAADLRTHVLRFLLRVSCIPVSVQNAQEQA